MTATLASAQTTYKCGAVFQDHPCPGAIVAATHPAAAAPSTPDAVLRILQAQPASPDAAPAASPCGQWLDVAVGMKKDRVLRCTMYRGEPKTINTTTTAAGVSEQYVFEPFGASGPTHYLYFTAGVLTAIQN